MNVYRIYVAGDDLVGWHTAMYYHKDSAAKYFANIRKKYPDTYVITETLDDNTGNVISRKEFSRKAGDNVDEVKATRQEYVRLIRYNIKWNEETEVCSCLSPDEAAEEMIAAVSQPGYGTEWIYIVRHVTLVDEVFIDQISTKLIMKTTL